MIEGAFLSIVINLFHNISFLTSLAVTGSVECNINHSLHISLYVKFRHIIILRIIPFIGEKELMITMLVYIHRNQFPACFGFTY